MNRLAVSVLSVAAVMLTAVLAQDLFRPDPGATPMAPAHGTTAAPPAPAPTPAPRLLAESVQVALARPLFSPDRRPAPSEGGTLGGSNELPRLTGILVSPDGNLAIFAAGEGGRSQVLREGSRIGRSVIAGITRDGVTLLDGPERRVLRTRFDPLAQASSAAPGVNRTSDTNARPATPQGILPTGAETGQLGGPPGASSRGASSLPFAQNPAPSGLDIILNLNRNAAKPTGTP